MCEMVELVCKMVESNAVMAESNAKRPNKNIYKLFCFRKVVKIVNNDTKKLGSGSGLGWYLH